MINFLSLRSDAIDALGRIFRQFETEISADQIIPLIDEACFRFHVIAVAGLLEDGDSEKFFLNLCRAGENWRRLLLHCRSKGVKLPIASRLAPLLGAVIAGDWGIASGIANNSASEFRAGEEYVDEFNVARLLIYFVKTPTIDVDFVKEGMRLIDEIDSDLNENRITVFRSLLTRDRVAFQISFEGLVAEHEVITESKARSFSTSYTKFALHRYVWFEGLAWLKIAERHEMFINRQYRYCPPLARLPMRKVYAGDWVLPVKC